MANKAAPNKFADGGTVGANNPSLALAYANGGQVGDATLALNYPNTQTDNGSLDQNGRGPWSGNLNSNTTTFNQDYLRGPSFGSQNMAGLVMPPSMSVNMPTAGGGSVKSAPNVAGPGSQGGDAGNGVSNSAAGVAQSAVDAGSPTAHREAETAKAHRG